MVLEMMRDFLEQDFMTIPGYEEKSYAEIVAPCKRNIGGSRADQVLQKILFISEIC